MNGKTAANAMYTGRLAKDQKAGKDLQPTIDKMNALIDEVCGELAEREELVHTIALALLTGKNLFVIGEPGQAKSQAIDLFRSHITGAKQFDILMSKGTDQEQLFGRWI